MLFAIRIIMTQAILRLHKAQAPGAKPARHGPPARCQAGLPLRARLAGRRPHRPVVATPTESAEQTPAAL
jgi:hypothetical protein